MNIVFVTPDLSSNSLGRTFSLWLLAEASGWSSVVLSPTTGPIWAPLQNSAFAETCRTYNHDDPSANASLASADLIIAVKPFESSFGLAERFAVEHRKPLLLDVDDPDLEGALSWRRPIRRLAKGILKPELVRSRKEMKRRARQTPTIVSNPYLQAIYGGEIIPHVRLDPGPGAPHLTTAPVVAFVGTNRRHKGIDVLRGAVAQCQDLDYRLVITDTAPRDAKPWEQWIGSTSLEGGRQIVADSDVVVIPSLSSSDAVGQLPAKLMDALLAARAVVVSDIDPLPWAVGDSGKVVAAGSERRLASVLRELADPHVRSTLGTSARTAALERFTVDSNVQVFQRACAEVLSAYQSRERTDS